MKDTIIEHLKTFTNDHKSITILIDGLHTGENR